MGRENQNTLYEKKICFNRKNSYKNISSLSIACVEHAQEGAGHLEFSFHNVLRYVISK